MATQKDVAKLANVSFITVSRVVNNVGNVKPETRKRVEEAIKTLNYYPNSIAQGLNRNRVNTVAVESSTPEDQAIEETSYYIRLLAGIERYCIKTGYDILISSQRGKIDGFDCLAPYYKRKADGVIILGAKPNEDQFKKIEEENIPCVIIGDRSDDYNSNYIDTDNTGGVIKSAEYLIKCGHTKIGFITGDVWARNMIDRFEGYKTALKNNNIDFNETYVFNGDYSKQSGIDAYKYYRSLENPPTAVIAGTDLMAIGLFEEAKNRGETIPETFSVVGFDGHELGKYMTPNLTTVKQPLEEMGYEAAKILIKHIEDPTSEPEHIVFPVDLVTGGSVKKGSTE